MRKQMGPDWLTDDFAPIEREYLEHGTIQGLPHAVLVARVLETGALVGFAEVSLREFAEGCLTSPVGYLEGWFVVPGARSHGIGRALVEAGERWAGDQGCAEFASDAELDNTDSLLAHEQLGFDAVSDVRCFRKDLGPE